MEQTENTPYLLLRSNYCLKTSLSLKPLLGFLAENYFPTDLSSLPLFQTFERNNKMSKMLQCELKKFNSVFLVVG